MLLPRYANFHISMKPFERSGPHRRAHQSAAKTLLGDYGDSGGDAVQTLQIGSSPAYNEEAFHYFLELERKRSEVSNRPFLLMLIDLKGPGGFNSQIDAVTAHKVLLILSRCLRETDFIGWYREGCVAGAVLTQSAESIRDDLSEVVRLRIDAQLERHFPAYRSSGLEIRVNQLSPGIKFRDE
jgi:hypothetical protein